MNERPIEMTLASIGRGDLMECATEELRKICANVADPNVQTDAKRKLQITIEIKPDAKGQTATITYSVQSTMPGPAAGKTMAYIAMAPGSSVISLYEVETHPPLFEEPQLDFPKLAPAKHA